jgi:hypothetical protein
MIGELCELWDWLKAATSGWRFIFSPTFRAGALAGWRAEKWYYILWDIICGFAGIAFSLLPVVGIVYLMTQVSWK